MSPYSISTRYGSQAVQPPDGIDMERLEEEWAGAFDDVPDLCAALASLLAYALETEPHPPIYLSEEQKDRIAKLLEGGIDRLFKPYDTTDTLELARWARALGLYPDPETWAERRSKEQEDAC